MYVLRCWAIINIALTLLLYPVLCSTVSTGGVHLKSIFKIIHQGHYLHPNIGQVIAWLDNILLIHCRLFCLPTFHMSCSPIKHSSIAVLTCLLKLCETLVCNWMIHVFLQYFMWCSRMCVHPIFLSRYGNCSNWGFTWIICDESKLLCLSVYFPISP